MSLILCVCIYLYFSAATPSGYAFARKIIEKAGPNGGEVMLGYPSSKSRYCFAPYVSDVGELLEKQYLGMPVAFHETDDSNKWYVMYNSEDQGGVIILGVSHGVLRWNCEPCSAFTEELNWDKKARPVCVDSVIISYFGETRIPTFRPKY